MPAFPLERVVG